MKTPFHVMLIPTLGCPARCSYCWSSDHHSPVMTMDTLKETVAWLRLFQEGPMTITFHGGEPLLAGAEFYKNAFPMLVEGLLPLVPSFAMQSNLWLMTPELAHILATYNVPIGTSIDGPKDLTDLQRGKGYFERTMRGYEIARAQGLRVSFICTFTSQSVRSKEEIFTFFLENGFILKLHPALPSLRNTNPQPWVLGPEEYGNLLMFLLNRYLIHLEKMEIMNINDVFKSVFTRRGTVCTFADCMGSTYAVGPDGGIYPCYRFVGMPGYVMGNVRDCPSKEELTRSPAGKLMNQFKEYVDTACKDCRHIKYCRGGCPYNAIVLSGGTITGVDPYCLAYKRIFDEISGRIDAELFGSCNIEMTPFHTGPRKQDKTGIMSLMQKMVLR